LTYTVYIKLYKNIGLAIPWQYPGNTLTIPWQYPGNTLACNYVKVEYKSLRLDFYVFKKLLFLSTYCCVTSVGHVAGIVTHRWP